MPLGAGGRTARRGGARGRPVRGADGRPAGAWPAPEPPAAAGLGGGQQGACWVAALVGTGEGGGLRGGLSTRGQRAPASRLSAPKHKLAGLPSSPPICVWVFPGDGCRCWHFSAAPPKVPAHALLCRAAPHRRWPAAPAPRRWQAAAASSQGCGPQGGEAARCGRPTKLRASPLMRAGCKDTTNAAPWQAHSCPCRTAHAGWAARRRRRCGLGAAF